MKRGRVLSLGLILLLTATSGGDEKAVSRSTGRIRIEKCHINLIDQVTLSFDRAGILKVLEWKEGDSVEKGTLLAQVADEVARATLAVARKKASDEVELQFARVAKKAADTEHRRLLNANQIALEKGGKEPVAQLEIDKAQLAADKAELSIKKAEQDLALNQLEAEVKAAELDTCSLRAEFPGKVHKIFRKKGEAVRQGDPVIEIVNTDRVRVEGNVSPSDLRFAKQGAKVRVWRNDDGQSNEKEFLEGHLTFIAQVSNPIDRKTRVYADIENRGNLLRAGHEAIMEIQVGDPLAVGGTQRANEKDSNTSSIAQ